MGCHALLQGIFPTQESNPGLLHCKTLADANEAVETVTDQAAAAVTTANAAQATATQANTTAAEANQRATYAETDAQAAAANAGTALSTAQGAASAANTALARASEANDALAWGYKGSLMRNTPNELGTLTVPLLNVPHTMMLVFSAAPSWSSYTNRSVEIPRAFLLEENQTNGTAPRTAAGLNIAIGTPSAAWTINVICDGDSVTVRHVSADTSQAELYCRVYAR